MPRLTPGLEDIRLSFSLLSAVEVDMLEDVEFRCLMQLVRFAAAGLVWTYSEPGDGSLPDDDKLLARIARMRPAQWRKVRPTMARFFVIRDGKWHLDRPWISVVNEGRLAIPLAIQAEVASREGRRCTYCGTKDGPFHFDHIFPVSKGGTNAPSNLTLACEPCNLSKGSKTLTEWMTSATAPLRIYPKDERS